MVKIKVYLQNNKMFETEVDTYNSDDIAQKINSSDSLLVAIGNLTVNKHHIEIIVPE